jgi:hypothetical protein
MKKVIAIFTVFSFLIYITSCYSYKTLTSQKEYSKYSGNEKIDVLNVQTKQGNKIEFIEKYPGRISEKGVVGLPQLRLQYGTVDSFTISGKSDKAEFIWKNGINYEVITQDKLDFICHASDTIHIPLSDIEKLDFKRFSKGKTIGLVSGIAGGAMMIIVVLAVMGLSNPFSGTNINWGL